MDGVIIEPPGVPSAFRKVLDHAFPAGLLLDRLPDEGLASASEERTLVLPPGHAIEALPLVPG
jgi:hypothetical protein